MSAQLIRATKNIKMKRKQILVTGASGMTASYVPAIFDDVNLILTDVSDSPVQLDICDTSAVTRVVEDARPDVILHLGAATDVDRCEQDSDWAYRVNAMGTENLALACRKIDATMVYVSTAAVFLGDQADPYVETDDTGPLSAYGQSKLEGERHVRSVLSRYYIVRAGWMIGGGVRDKKFVGKMARFIVDGKTELSAVDDKIGSPTYAKDLIRGIKGLLDTDDFGLFHMVNEGLASRYDVAVSIAQSLGRTDLTINPVSSDAFPLPAPRGRSEALQNLKLELIGMPPMRPWRDALHEYLTEELMPELAPAD